MGVNSLSDEKAEPVTGSNFTVAELMFYSTARIVAGTGDTVTGTGTGFFMELAKVEDGRCLPAIVTNKHVIQGCDYVEFRFSLGESQPSGEYHNAKVALTAQRIILHPDASVDLCAIIIGDISAYMRSIGKPIFYCSVGFEIIPTDDEWNSFDAIEEVTMVGCPNGLYDEANNLPIARRGITATPLFKKYNGKNEFLVDMACFPGSSGSPVFSYSPHGYVDRPEKIYRIGSQRILFVGILYAGPQIANDGQIILGQVPTVRVASMMHLGNVIRSSALREIEAEAKRRAAPAAPVESNLTQPPPSELA